MFSKELLTFIQESKQKGLNLVGTSVIATQGSTYAKAGNMMLVNSNDEFVGVLGSAPLHKKILALSKEALQGKTPMYFENHPEDKSSGHGISKYLIHPFFFTENYGALTVALENFGKSLVRSIKDNTYEIIDKKCDTKLEGEHFYQSIQRPYSLLIFGAGAHVRSLIQMANLMGWRTTSIDLHEKSTYVQEADEYIQLQKLEDIMEMNLEPYNASVILSHSPKTDDTYLKALVKSDLEYIGIMGNKKSMDEKKKVFNLQEDKRFFAPVGFNIGGNTHQSIALSICSQIEARKNAKI